jgi:carbonic anhydrase
MTPASALDRLKAGNERFVSDSLLPKHYHQQRRATLRDQSPYATVITCADSRIAPEIIFDETLGQLSVVRIAGNVIDPVVVGSAEFAAIIFHTPLIVVLGHEYCAAIRAAMEGVSISPAIDSIVGLMPPGIKAESPEDLKDEAVWRRTIRANVAYQVQRLEEESSVIATMIKEHRLAIIGGKINLTSGKVEFFDMHD